MSTYPDALLRRWCKVASTRRHVPGRALRAQDLARVEAESGIPLADLIAFADANGWYEEGQS